MVTIVACYILGIVLKSVWLDSLAWIINAIAGCYIVLIATWVLLHYADIAGNLVDNVDYVATFTWNMVKYKYKYK